MRIYFNDDNSLKGIEGWYDLEFKPDTLVVYLNPTSPGIDWFIDCLAFPVPVDMTDPFGPWCHAGFKKYAYWLAGMIFSLKMAHNFHSVVLTGFSMGGGVAQLAALICESWYKDMSVRAVSIDGPRTTSRLPENLKLYYNRGSLVHSIPLWFQMAAVRICLNKSWRWFWKSHADYDIERIISDEI